VSRNKKSKNNNHIIITVGSAGLAMLMALIRVVLKWKTSATYQSHIYESIDLSFGKVDYVTRSTNPGKLGKDCRPISGGAPTWW
jgi:hypothetical protein